MRGYLTCSAQGSQVSFEDGPALCRVGRRGVLDPGPQVVEIGDGKLGAQDRIGDADPVGGTREGQDVELVSAALVERGAGLDHADCRMRAAVEGEQMLELVGHGPGALEGEFEGAL